MQELILNFLLSCLVVIIVGIILALPGCSKPEVTNTISTARIGFTITALVNTWSEDRLILKKYLDKLDVNSNDYKSLANIIATGDSIHYNLANMSESFNVLSPSRIKITYKEANLMFTSGKVLYEKYKQYISAQDRIRAEELNNQWTFIQGEINSLINSSNKTDRYQALMRMAEFTLDITSQIVIPILKSTNTI